MKIKYIRVSTTHQNTERQEANVASEQFDKVYVDKQSGKDTNRPQFQEMMNFIREGDVVYFESFSRLSRSLPDLLNTLEAFEKKGVKWVSEKEQLNTEGAAGKLIVAVLGAIAQYEREVNKERREYGFEKAKSEGRVGRPAAEITPAFEEAYKEWQAGKITAVEAMKRAEMSKSVFYRKVKEYQAK